MGTEDNPDLWVEYFDGSTWENVLSYCKSFNVWDAGILKIPVAEIVLRNKNGMFTSGADKIPIYSKTRIRGDVRGVTDTIFEGRYYKPSGKIQKKTHDLTMICRNFGQKLLHDSKTKKYGEEVGWTYKTMIEDFLANPDSGYDTGIVLDTDGGTITTTAPIESPEQEYLLDLIREIAERINYDGYMSTETNLVFKAVGTIPTNPAVTLSSPFVSCYPEFPDVEEIKNFIMPWGDIERCYPTDDRWTEQTITKYPLSWIGGDNTTVEDSQEQQVLGDYSIKATRITDNGKIRAIFDLSKVGISSIDLSERFLTLDLQYRHNFAGHDVNVTLEDTSGSRITRGNYPNTLYNSFRPVLKAGKWHQKSWKVGPDQKIETGVLAEYNGWKFCHWWRETGETFSWNAVKKIEVWTSIYTDPNNSFYVDYLRFGGGKLIDPLLYPELIKKDDSSIESYGRRVYPIKDTSLRSFSSAEAYANRLLSTLKSPIRKVRVAKGAKIWTKPTQTLVFNLPEWEINNETWRIAELETYWKSSTKLLRREFTLIPQYEPLSRKAFTADELAGLLKELS